MKDAHSISTRRAYGVQRVYRVWHRARSSRLLKNSAKWDRQIDPVVLRCSQH